MNPPPAGYSGTPLARKLGIAEGSRVVVKGGPAGYRGLLKPIPDGVVFQQGVSRQTDIVHVFADRRSALRGHLAKLRKKIRDDAAVWVSWPKKASGMETDITEDTIRELALPLGLVDVKVCAIDETWSGLKLVIRKALRAR
jgi:hypothetical protein